MTDRLKMVDDICEKVARAIYAQNPAVQPWNGDPYAFHESGAGHNRSRACKQADAAIYAYQEALKDNGWIMFRPEDVTRINVIGDTVSEVWADECFAAVQDDGRTLKLFPCGEGKAAQDARAKSLVEDLKTAIAKKNIKDVNVEL